VINDDDEMRALIADFISGLPERLSKINQTAQLNDWAALAAAAHKLKGSAGMYGFPELALSASELEKAAKNCEEAPALTRCKELTSLLERIQRGSTELSTSSV
jgi:HPt (histidine-containing phosphotransfer) domain-containing protein